jgi:hypothetical protein
VFIWSSSQASHTNTRPVMVRMKTQ